MIEMMKNPKCLPYKVYVERWTFLKKKQDKKKKLTLKDLPLVNDELLPPIDLTLPIAMAKIKENKKCVPFDLYVKRWNELKTLSKHKKRFS
jgi:phage regulator Rha-like protein